MKNSNLQRNLQHNFQQSCSCIRISNISAVVPKKPHTSSNKKIHIRYANSDMKNSHSPTRKNEETRGHRVVERREREDEGFTLVGGWVWVHKAHVATEKKIHNRYQPVMIGQRWYTLAYEMRRADVWG